MRNRIAVDFVGRYENLADDLREALRHVGLVTELPLPRTKARFRRDKRHYTELLDVRSRALLERVCARELAAFDYGWTQPGRGESDRGALAS